MPDYDTSWALLVIGLGPDRSGARAHVVVETRDTCREPIREGSAIADTGNFHRRTRLDRVFALHTRGTAESRPIFVKRSEGDTILTVDGTEVKARLPVFSRIDRARKQRH